jgi:hypothetical protein
MSRTKKRRKECTFCGVLGHVEQHCKMHTEYLHTLAPSQYEVSFGEADLDGTWELPSLTDLDCGERVAICHAIHSSFKAFDTSAAAAASWEKDVERAYLASQIELLREYRERRGRLVCSPSIEEARCDFIARQETPPARCFPVLPVLRTDSSSDDMRAPAVIVRSSSGIAAEAA